MLFIGFFFTALTIAAPTQQRRYSALRSGVPARISWQALSGLTFGRKYGLFIHLCKETKVYSEFSLFFE